MTSETLGLELRFEDDRLRLWDPAAREYLLEPAEERAGRLEERKGRLEERKGRLEERAGRIAAEQRVRDLESAMADREERLRRES